MKHKEGLKGYSAEGDVSHVLAHEKITDQWGVARQESKDSRAGDYLNVEDMMELVGY